MRRISRNTFLLGAVLLLAFCIRLPAVSYGLPYHVFGDEETNVYGALLMLEHHTVLPVLHQSDFTILYEPPMLAYLYAALFVPTIAAAYIFSGAHNFSHFISLLTLDPSVLWYVGRVAGVLFGLASIYLVYKIGQELFKNNVIALVSALFLATSFLDATIAPTTRHWTPGTFCSLLALWLVLKAYNETTQHRKYFFIAAGFSLGLSFGFSYLPYYVPFVAALVIYFNFQKESLKRTTLAVLWDGLYIGLPFILFAIAIVLVDPYPFYVQIIHHVQPSSAKSVGTFITYYLRTLWDYETPILLGSVAGLVMLWWKKEYTLLLLFGVFLITVVVPMYIFLPNLGRYLVPLLPMLSLLAGYGVYACAQLVPVINKNIPLIGMTVVLLIYAVAVFGRLEILLVQQDTRVQAKNWIETTIPAGSMLLTNSDRLRLEGTSASLAIQSQISPESLRAQDKLLLQDPTLATHPFDLYTLALAMPDKEPAIINAVLKDPARQKYLVEDSWATTTPPISLQKVLLKKFEGSGMVPGLDGLFIGGANAEIPVHVLGLLYGVDSLGPDVSIYTLK